MESEEVINQPAVEVTTEASEETDKSDEGQNPQPEPRKKRSISPPKYPRGSKPPALSLDEAAEIITTFYEDTAGEASYDALSNITDNSPGSSVFINKLAALKNYGLMADENRVLSLTELGFSVAAPHTPADRVEALKEAFLKVDNFKNAYEKYKGRLLPQDEFLRNAFTSWVPVDLASEWVETFKSSADIAGLLEERNGKLQVRESVRIPEGEKEEAPAPVLKEAEAPPSRIEESQAPHTLPAGVIRTPLALGPGRLAYIELPKDWKPAELKKLLRLLALSLGDDADFEEVERMTS